MQFVWKAAGVAAMLVCLTGGAQAEQAVVLGTVDSEGYTYVEVEQNGQKSWIAVNEMKLKPGDKLQFDPGMDMTNFQSSSLHRVFPTMRFVTNLKVVTDNK